MNKNLNFDEIYEDFFGKTTTLLEKEDLTVKENNQSTPSLEELLREIDSLLITEESIELLKKIVTYMAYDKKDKTYVPFHLELNINNRETITRILEILQNELTVSQYLKGKEIGYLSMYKLDKVEILDEYYQKYSIIVIKDITGFKLKEPVFQKQFLHSLQEHLKEEKMTIIVGSNTDTSFLWENDLSLKRRNFPFVLEGVEPTTEKIWNDLAASLPKEQMKNELWTYIEATFKESGLDYPTYRDNLKHHLEFYKEIPKLENTKTTEEVFQELNELVGLEKVKRTLYELVDYITLKKKTEGDLKLSSVNLHMLFLGNPGTGKTTVARMLSNILYNLKYIRQNKLIEVSSKDLVAEYVGQTSPKTMEVIERARGGILFIDEAYSLASDPTNSYNKEAVATLIKAMEDYREDLVVIFAGYTKEMQDFIALNSGIASRIGYTFIFEDYTNEELKDIFLGMMKKAGFTVTKEALLELEERIIEARPQKNFGNARFIRNVYEKTIIKHATNTKDIKDKKKLTTIEKEDISSEGNL